MSDPIHSRPFSSIGRENYGRIFRKTDPVHALTPGTIREYRSDCCGAEVFWGALGGGLKCRQCMKSCTKTLTKIN